MAGRKQTKLFIPVVLGTARAGRRSENAAKLVFSEFEKWPEIRTELVDVKNFLLGATVPSWDEDERIAKWREIARSADGFIIVSPEYNRGIPGELKMLLDSAYDEYEKKAAGICGVSDGRVGGARMIETLRITLATLGLVAVRPTILFPNVDKIFDEDGALLDKSCLKAFPKFFDEVIWYAKVLKEGRKTDDN